MANEQVTGDDVEAVGDGPGLTPREEAFCRAYGDVESPTYGRGAKSAEAAGYSGPRSAALKLRRRPHVKARLKAYYGLARAAVEKVISDLEHARLAALEKGDVASAVRASELQGKHLAMFTDRVGLDLPELQALTEAQIVEGQRLTRLLLLESNASGLCTISAAEVSGLPAPAPALEKGTDDAKLHDS